MGIISTKSEWVKGVSAEKGKSLESRRSPYVESDREAKEAGQEAPVNEEESQ